MTDPSVTASSKDWAGAVASLFLGGVGAYVFVASFAMSPMAAMFPRTIGAILVGLSLLQIAAALTGRSARSMEVGASIAEQAEGLGRRLVLIGTMISWAVLFPLVGMFVTSLAACTVLMFTALFDRLTGGRLAVFLCTTFVMVTVFYLLMTRVLHIPMPRGVLF